MKIPVDKATQKKEKEKLKKLKLEARRMWILHDAPPEKEKIPKWEFELFKKIAEEQRDWDFVNALHMNFDWEVVVKRIRMEDLTPENFHHECPKSRGEEHRLNPDNILIVSRAYHHWEHTKQILKVDYPN